MIKIATANVLKVSCPPPPLNPPPFRLALVEDDVHFVKAFSAAVAQQTDLVLAHAVSTLAQGLRLLDLPPADALLVDLGLPDGSGIDMIAATTVRWPTCAIMVNSTFADEAHVLAAIDAGAVGYLLKDSAANDMMEELRHLLAGGSPISPLIARQILKRFRNVRAEPTRPAATRPVEPPASLVQLETAGLSPRETIVLTYFTKGFSAQEIAALLQISHPTVLTYIRRIYAKLNVRSKAEAIYEARMQGLLAL